MASSFIAGTAPVGISYLFIGGAAAGNENYMKAGQADDWNCQQTDDDHYRHTGRTAKDNDTMQQGGYVCFCCAIYQSIYLLWFMPSVL